jgi:hypothetical protein
MIKNATIIRRILFRLMCITVVLILGGSLFTAGAMSSGDCRMKCCCKANSMAVQLSAEESMRSMHGCCSGNEARPCDIRKDVPGKLAAITLTSCHPNLSGGAVNVASLTDTTDRQNKSDGQIHSQELEPNYSSPLLYLQQLSFLI